MDGAGAAPLGSRVWGVVLRGSYGWGWIVGGEGIKLGMSETGRSGETHPAGTASATEQAIAFVKKPVLGLPEFQN